MANHSPEPDNYVGKKTWDEAMNGDKPSKPSNKSTSTKGAASKNGGD